MAAYGAGRYAEAARALDAVATEDRTPALAFYLGVARLLSGRPREAISVLRSISPESPYSTEARYYLAKAWLRLSAADSALAALARVPADATMAPHAAALADSVRKVDR